MRVTLRPGRAISRSGATTVGPETIKIRNAKKEESTHDTLAGAFQITEIQLQTTIEQDDGDG
jgi:hypothetical protein